MNNETQPGSDEARPEPQSGEADTRCCAKCERYGKAMQLIVTELNEWKRRYNENVGENNIQVSIEPVEDIITKFMYKVDYLKKRSVDD